MFTQTQRSLLPKIKHDREIKYACTPYILVKVVLSKAEMEFLKNPEKFDGVYRRVLRHRINVKSVQMREHAMLLQGIGLNVTENCNAVTNSRNANQDISQALNAKTSEIFGAPAGIRTRVFGSKGRNT